MKRIIFSFLIIGLISGCALSPRDIYIQQHPELSEQLKEDIATGTLRLGMTKEQVEATWFAPLKKHKSVTEAGVIERWEYSLWADWMGRYEYYYVLYFRNGELVRIVDLSD